MRCKGLSSLQVDQEFPQQIELPAPDGGFGARLNDFHRACESVEYATTASRKPARSAAPDGIRFCFRTTEHADMFLARFGGERLKACAGPEPALARIGMSQSQKLKTDHNRAVVRLHSNRTNEGKR
jgi:hypothetical protein